VPSAGRVYQARQLSGLELLDRDLSEPPDLGDWVVRYVPKHRLLQGDAPLFVNPNTGGRWEESALKRAFYKARDMAELPNVSMYEAGKHSMATEGYSRIRDERKVQAMLGHADVRSTRRPTSGRRTCRGASPPRQRRRRLSLISAKIEQGEAQVVDVCVELSDLNGRSTSESRFRIALRPRRST
jgi:hypothetical protein